MWSFVTKFCRGGERGRERGGRRGCKRNFWAVVCCCWVLSFKGGLCLFF